MKDVRRGITQAKFNEDASNWLFFEIFFISLILGLISKSWWVFGGLLFGMMGLLFSRKMAIILMIALTIFWAFVGYTIGAYWGFSASVVLAALALFCVGGLHLGALDWMKDMKYTEKSIQIDDEMLRENAYNYAINYWLKQDNSEAKSEIEQIRNWRMNPSSNTTTEKWYQENKQSFK